MNPLLGASLISVGGGLINNLLQNKSLDKQVAAQKDLMDYQWKNFQSPLAQALKIMRQRVLIPLLQWVTVM